MSTLPSFIRKELTQALRDPRMRIILFAAPLLQLVIFGYVATTDIRNIRLAVVDQDRSSASRELADAFFASGYFVPARPVRSAAEAEAALERNDARVALVIPAGFARDLDRRVPAPVQILFDGTDGNSTNITKAYVEGIVAAFSAERMAALLDRLPQAVQLKLGAGPRVEPEVRVFYNPELRSSSFMVPGILCMILLLVTALLSGMSITREKELGTLEQILVSPVRRLEFILGKTIPFVLVGLINVVLVLVAAKILFRIPVRGSLVLLFFSSLIFLFTSLGLGLFGASVSRNQTQVLLSIFPFMMPAFLLSGLFFPVASIPQALRWIAYVNPLFYFLVIVRGILLKGVGLAVLWPQISALAVFGVGLITFSSLRFRKRLE